MVEDLIDVITVVLKEAYHYLLTGAVELRIDAVDVASPASASPILYLKIVMDSEGLQAYDLDHIDACVCIPE